MGRLAIVGLWFTATAIFAVAASFQRADGGPAWKWLSIAGLAVVCMAGMAAVLIF